MVDCPSCGSPDCITPAEDVLCKAMNMYSPCGSCMNEVPLEKLKPFESLGLKLDAGYRRCPSCGRRHLDVVMAHVMDVLIGSGCMSGRSPLKDVGTPLIRYGVPLMEPPRLGSREVVMIVDNVDSDTARKIMDEVPEIKGVLLRKGSPVKSVGILDTNTSPHLYKLMAGCDMRADVVSCALGELVFYRNQSEIHIEFWRNNSTKIKMIERLFMEGMLEGRVVVDGFAGVGTLGLFTALIGAKKVILNDAWLPAIRNLILNIEANKNLLGVEVVRIADITQLSEIGEEPVLVARATGLVDIEVYHGDFRNLDSVVPDCDICIIDTFPMVNPAPFTEKWKEMTNERIVTL